MPLAAILSATLPSSDRPDLMRGNIVFAAQTVIEFQARLAAYAGAESVFIMIEGLTSALSRVVDRLSGEGLDVHLVRDMQSLVKHLPRESDILLFADGIVVDQRYVTEIGAVEGNALLVVADDAATAGLERVDATNRWGGVARITPKLLFNTLDLIGDWDLTLTLLRTVVQNDPQRIAIDRKSVV